MDLSNDINKNKLLKYVFTHENPGDYTTAKIKAANSLIDLKYRDCFFIDNKLIDAEKSLTYKTKWNSKEGTVRDKSKVHRTLNGILRRIIISFKGGWNTHKDYFNNFCSLLTPDYRNYIYHKQGAFEGTLTVGNTWKRTNRKNWNTSKRGYVKEAEMMTILCPTFSAKKNPPPKPKARWELRNEVVKEWEEAKKKKTEHENFRCISKRKMAKNKNCYNKERIVKKWERKIKELKNKYISLGGQNEPHITKLKF